MSLCIENIEGYTDYNIQPVKKRQPGLSAMMRIKDEALFLEAAVKSIAPWVDEIVICLQGKQSDQTPEVAAELLIEYPYKVRVYHYPFESRPNGPGHDEQPQSSVSERAYFYNWCLSCTTHHHVMKWDGDMVAIDYAGDQIKDALQNHDFIRFAGIEIVAKNPLRVAASRPYTSAEMRIFRATDSYYVSGKYCESLIEQSGKADKKVFKDPFFLHFKWCKPENSIKNAWPKNWREMPHFQRLWQRRQPGQIYNGEVPQWLTQTT